MQRLTCSEEVPEVQAITQVASKEHANGIGSQEGQVNLTKEGLQEEEQGVGCGEGCDLT